MATPYWRVWETFPWNGRCRKHLWPEAYTSRKLAMAAAATARASEVQSNPERHAFVVVRETPEMADQPGRYVVDREEDEEEA